MGIEKLLYLLGLKPLDEEFTAVLEAAERTLRGAADAVSMELRHRLYPPADYADDKIEGAFKR